MKSRIKKKSNSRLKSTNRDSPILNPRLLLQSRVTTTKIIQNDFNTINGLIFFLLIILYSYEGERNIGRKWETCQSIYLLRIHSASLLQWEFTISTCVTSSRFLLWHFLSIYFYVGSWSLVCVTLYSLPVSILCGLLLLYLLLWRSRPFTTGFHGLIGESGPDSRASSIWWSWRPHWGPLMRHSCSWWHTGPL